MEKLIRKKVREDIKRYEDERVMNLIEECRSTKKVKKALNTGKNLIIKLKDVNGNFKVRPHYAARHSKSRAMPQVYVDVASARLQHAVRCCAP